MRQTFRHLEQAIRREGNPAFIPVYEHGVDLPIVSAVMGIGFDDLDLSSRDGMVRFWKRLIAFYDQMGYPALSFEMGIHFARIQTGSTRHDDIEDPVRRGWVDERNGPIASWEDLENPANWPDIGAAFDYDVFEEVAALVPDHMQIVGGASGGPFEHASFLMGLENLCVTLAEDEAFAETLFRKIGETLVGTATRLAAHDRLGIYRFGDDLGYKMATILSPDMLRQYVFPWQKRVVEAVHRAGKPFLLHSCGQLAEVMDDLIDEVGIDGKHSFEDVILPVEEAVERWGSRIAIFGGIDVDFLCRATPNEIRERTLRTMDRCGRGGGYAIGSGNTITSYVPVDNYLALMGAVASFNGT